MSIKRKSDMDIKYIELEELQAKQEELIEEILFIWEKIVEIKQQGVANEL